MTIFPKKWRAKGVEHQPDNLRFWVIPCWYEVFLSQTWLGPCSLPRKRSFFLPNRSPQWNMLHWMCCLVSSLACLFQHGYEVIQWKLWPPVHPERWFSEVKQLSQPQHASGLVKKYNSSIPENVWSNRAILSKTFQIHPGKAGDVWKAERFVDLPEVLYGLNSAVVKTLSWLFYIGD